MFILGPGNKATLRSLGQVPSDEEVITAPAIPRCYLLPSGS